MKPDPNLERQAWSMNPDLYSPQKTCHMRDQCPSGLLRAAKRRYFPVAATESTNDEKKDGMNAPRRRDCDCWRAAQRGTHGSQLQGRPVEKLCRDIPFALTRTEQCTVRYRNSLPEIEKTRPN